MSESGSCAAFLANYNPSSCATVVYSDNHYNLPPWPINILPECKHTVYNTARVGAQSPQIKYTPIQQDFSCQSYNEETASVDDSAFTVVGLVEQINTTRDMTNYLWYSLKW